MRLRISLGWQRERVFLGMDRIFYDFLEVFPFMLLSEYLFKLQLSGIQ